MPVGRNVRLLLEYDGTRYHGWQRQQNAQTIQEVVEKALGRLTGEKITLTASGRTDAGVHARGQVANFFTHRPLPLRAFVYGLNSLLPRDIAVLEAQEVPPDFHARYSARAKTYEYRILNRSRPSPVRRLYTWWLSAPLNLEAMVRGAAVLIGEHDFSAFRASGCSSRQPVRHVRHAVWRREAPDGLIFSITANGFLRGMVRSLVGTMVEMGQGKRPPEDLAALLATGDRRLTGPTAPPQGLFLMEVLYGT